MEDRIEGELNNQDIGWLWAQNNRNPRTMSLECRHSNNSSPDAFSPCMTAQIEFLGGWAICLSLRG